MTGSVLVTDPAATAALAGRLAALLADGGVVCLSGGLGAGKTAFARGVLAGLGVADEVPSPTFNLVLTYDTAIGTVWHFDLYRIEAPGELAEIGLDAALEEGVLLVEWPDRLAGRLPADRLDVAIEALDGSPRRIAWQGHGSRGRTLAAALAAAAA